jgi:hypothetical protein
VAAGYAETYPLQVVLSTRMLSYGGCSSLSRHLVGVGVPALVGLLGLVLGASAP